MTGNTLRITPFMHVEDLNSAAAFMTDILGFEIRFFDGPGGYAYVCREGAGIRILASANAAERGKPHGGFQYYIDVRNLDVVLDQIGEKLEQLPEGTVIGPRDQPYGQRELMIRAPDGNLIVFGQALN